MPALFPSSALSRPPDGEIVTHVQLLASLSVCFPAQELIPSLRKLERLLEAVEKL